MEVLTPLLLLRGVAREDLPRLGVIQGAGLRVPEDSETRRPVSVHLPHPRRQETPRSMRVTRPELLETDHVAGGGEVSEVAPQRLTEPLRGGG